MRKTLIIAAAMLTASTVPALSEGDVAKGEAVFKRCSACHAIGGGAKTGSAHSLTASLAVRRAACLTILIRVR